MTESRWWPALRLMLIGLATGAVLVWIVGGLPERAQPWVVVALIGVMFGWVVREWLGLRKLQREVAATIEQLRRDHPGL